MSLKDLFTGARNLALKSMSQTAHSAVIDASDNTLVAIGTYSPALLFVNESMMDTLYVADISSADVTHLIGTSSPRTYPEWSWDTSSRTFRKTNASLITEDMRNRAVLAVKKAEVVSRIIYRINRMRRKASTGLLFQEMVYAEKEREAQMLKAVDFDESRGVAAPYVSQYAEDSGVSLRQAAEEILLQAQLDHDLLARTERVRLAVFKKIRLAKTVEEVEEIFGTFQKTGTV